MYELSALVQLYVSINLCTRAALGEWSRGYLLTY